VDHSDASAGTGLYMATWLVLLALTVLMVVIDSAPLPRVIFLVVVMSAMAVKASLIGANFMHLRFERRLLVVMVVVGLVVNGAILFILIVPDALRIGAMAP
jgi:caa(3)-type oxidase subunit IV